MTTALARAERDRGRDYLADRSYRLLNALVNGRPVDEMPADHASLFHAEERLGRMPLGEAFNELTEVHPRLQELADELRVRRSSRPVGESSSRSIADVLLEADEMFITPTPDGSIRHSMVALGIVYEYLSISAGKTPGSLEQSYFEREPRMGPPRPVFLGNSRTAQG